FFFQAEDGIRDFHVTGVQTCALPIGTASPTAEIRRLRLIPDGVVPSTARQPGLWGGSGHHRAHRALARVQGLLGPDSVVTAVVRGGRSPRDQVDLIPWGDARPAGDPAPWPGRLPPPAPAPVLSQPAAGSVPRTRGPPATGERR